MPGARIAIFGASGYSGAELVRVLLAHPHAEIAALGAEQAAGRRLEELYAAFRGAALPPLERLEPAGLKGRAELAFLALPHGQAMQLVPKLLDEGLRVIDLSGDFRLKDASAYESFYGRPHTAKDLLGQAVYGLPELHRAEIRRARLVANPGCYTTTSILALAPLLRAGLADPGALIIDAKSGVSGAGRKLSEATQFAEIYDNFSAYKVGGVHQHIPEIEQELSLAAGCDVRVSFTPHLLPLSRGILATCYAGLRVRADEETLRRPYQEAYRGEPFVRLCEPGALPDLRAVRGTNYCDLGLKLDARAGRAVVVACTDNLAKGAALQAVQNMNLMLGLDEAEGLSFRALPV